MGFRAHLIGKIQGFVRVHYQLQNNRTNYLKILQTNCTFLDPSSNEVYDMTINILKFVLLILSSRKLADLPNS